MSWKHQNNEDVFTPAGNPFEIHIREDVWRLQTDGGETLLAGDFPPDVVGGKERRRFAIMHVLHVLETFKEQLIRGLESS